MTTDHLTPMTTDALRRLQDLRGRTRTGEAHAVLAGLQVDLQAVIEAVLALAARENVPARPAAAESDEPVTEEPAVGEQVTDSEGDVWQRFDNGWRLRHIAADGWSYPRTWDDVQDHYGPLCATTDDDRHRVGHPPRDKNTPPASQNAQEARSADSGTGGPPEPGNAAQGRIGWLRMRPGDDCRYLMREVPSGWTRIDTDDEDLFWLRENYRHAVFTPIRTLADDEVAVKRGDLRTALDAVWLHQSAPAVKREAVDRLRAALEAGEDRG